MAITRLHPGVRFSQVVVHGDTVYVAGQVGDDPKADIAAQTRSALKRIERFLKAAGTKKSKLLACTVYLSNIANYDAMNKVYDRWVDKNNMPTRATIEGRLARPEYLVEITAIAAK